MNKLYLIACFSLVAAIALLNGGCASDSCDKECDSHAAAGQAK